MQRRLNRSPHGPRSRRRRGDLGRDELAADSTLVGRALCEAYADRADSFLRSLFASAADDRSRHRARRPRWVRPTRAEPAVRSRRAPAARRPQRHRRDRRAALVSGLGHRGEARATPCGPRRRRSPSPATTSTRPPRSSRPATWPATPHSPRPLVAKMRDLWAKRAKRLLPELAERVRERHRRAGEVAFLLEPDLKEGRGGLRDVQSLHWASRGPRAALGRRRPRRSHDAYGVLLDTRVELHRRTGRPGDVLLLQEQDGVAAASATPAPTT